MQKKEYKFKVTNRIPKYVLNAFFKDIKKEKYFNFVVKGKRNKDNKFSYDTSYLYKFDDYNEMLRFKNSEIYTENNDIFICLNPLIKKVMLELDEKDIKDEIEKMFLFIYSYNNSNGLSNASYMNNLQSQLMTMEMLGVDVDKLVKSKDFVTKKIKKLSTDSLNSYMKSPEELKEILDNTTLLKEKELVLAELEKLYLKKDTDNVNYSLINKCMERMLDDYEINRRKLESINKAKKSNDKVVKVDFGKK